MMVKFSHLTFTFIQYLKNLGFSSEIVLFGTLIMASMHLSDFQADTKFCYGLQKQKITPLI